MNKIFVTDPTVEELPLKYDAFQEIAKLNGFTELHDKITQRRRDIDKRLLMMVVGQGNFGKSTFINNFLQKEVAPVNFLPKTWKIDIYFPTKDKEYAEIFWKGKTVPEVVSIDKAKQICDQEEIKRSERKKENKSQKSDDIEEIQEVQWHLNIPSYTDEFCLVDTPGLGQQRDDTEIQSINLYGSKGIKLLSNDPFLKYYHRADLVLWCFRADKQNPKKTEEMLKKIGPYNKKIIGLITHMDKVPQDQWREVEQQIKGYFGSYVEEFLCIAGGNDIELQQSTYNKLRESLKAEILPQCEELKQESHINFYKKEALEFSSHLNNISTQYYHKNIQTMLTSIEYCNNQITKMHERTIQKLNQIIVDYFNDKVRQLEPIWNRAEASSSDTIQQFKLLLEQSLSDSSSLETRINSNIESEFKALESDINSYLNQESWTSLNLSREGKEVLNTPISISIKQLNGRVSSTNINQISGSEGDSEGIGFGAAGAAIGAFLLGPVGLLAAGVGFLAKAFFAKSKTIEKVTNSLSDANDKTQEQVIKMLCKMTDNFIDTSTAEIKLSHNQHVGRKTTDVTYLLGNFDHACHKLGTKYTEATPLSVLKNTAILSPHRFGVLQTILKFENLLNYEISVQDPLYEFSLLLSNWDKEQKKGVLNIVNNNKIKAEELINEMRVAIKNIVSEESAKKSLNLLTERINQLNSSNHKVINEIKSIQYAICPFLPSELLEELNEVHNSIRKIQNEAEQPLIELFCSKLNDLEIEELHLSHELIKKYSSDNKWLFSRHEEMITAQESITEKMMKDQIYNSCYIGHINDFSEAVKVRRIKRLDVIDRIELSLANHIKDNINKIISPMQEVTDPTQIITKLPELEFALNNLKTIKEKTSDFINQEILGAINNAHIVLEKMLRTAEIALIDRFCTEQNEEEKKILLLSPKDIQTTIKNKKVLISCHKTLLSSQKSSNYEKTKDQIKSSNYTNLISNFTKVLQVQTEKRFEIIQLVEKNLAKIIEKELDILARSLHDTDPNGLDSQSKELERMLTQVNILQDEVLGFSQKEIAKKITLIKSKVVDKLEVFIILKNKSKIRQLCNSSPVSYDWFPHISDTMHSFSVKESELDSFTLTTQVMQYHTLKDQQLFDDLTTEMSCLENKHRYLEDSKQIKRGEMPQLLKHIKEIAPHIKLITNSFEKDNLDNNFSSHSTYYLLAFILFGSIAYLGINVGLHIELDTWKNISIDNFTIHPESAMISSILSILITTILVITAFCIRRFLIQSRQLNLMLVTRKERTKRAFIEMQEVLERS